MPLVVPGVTVDNLGDQETQKWISELVGKTLTDGPSSETAFSKAKLPPNTEVINSLSGVSHEYKKDRLNVVLNEDGIVVDVRSG
ncbi:hypothetical protein SPI_02457 [Niveomyces insectorum RCEF 264]|uniref:Proteinase inhibitor I78 n=1 Tax=Niveomyces insectorum RCEF 264 TaxID=1081102 RepID=A0A162MRB1_9HYPO|nr:hypothetical protein SPI_02457 [Niveomyces insectorum RCEF 264]